MLPVCTSFLDATLQMGARFAYVLRTVPKSFHFSHHVPSYYTILGLKPDSTDDEIKQAYYSMSKLYHPDKNIGDQTAGRKILQINEAFEILGNKEAKEKYDKKMFPLLHMPKPMKSYIYDHKEYYDPPGSQKAMYTKASRINCTYEQYRKHCRGLKKKSNSHLLQKLQFNKNKGSSFALKAFHR